ncbi:hypothetical protein H920_00760 [Fukomys damarensis]|uniref:Uncharacterized protein n=1 Tax=Fukomys damarensis TaxID=885580 RepID=A0A091EQ30_FUKDA|nr:hypothetical protein H920_00760 [Fukomys damarensis]
MTHVPISEDMYNRVGHTEEEASDEIKRLKAKWPSRKEEEKKQHVERKVPESSIVYNHGLCRPVVANLYKCHSGQAARKPSHPSNRASGASPASESIQPCPGSSPPNATRPGTKVKAAFCTLDSPKCPSKDGERSDAISGDHLRVRKNRSSRLSEKARLAEQDEGFLWSRGLKMATEQEEHVSLNSSHWDWIFP